MKGKENKKCWKRTYSKLGAEYALAHAIDLHNDYRPIRIYLCNHCGNYHLTSKKYEETVLGQRKMKRDNKKTRHFDLFMMRATNAMKKTLEARESKYFEELSLEKFERLEMNERFDKLEVFALDKEVSIIHYIQLYKNYKLFMEEQTAQESDRWI